MVTHRDDRGGGGKSGLILDRAHRICYVVHVGVKEIEASKMNQVLRTEHWKYVDGI